MNKYINIDIYNMYVCIYMYIYIYIYIENMCMYTNTYMYTLFKVLAP